MPSIPDGSGWPMTVVVPPAGTMDRAFGRTRRVASRPAAVGTVAGPATVIAVPRTSTRRVEAESPGPMTRTSRKLEAPRNEATKELVGRW